MSIITKERLNAISQSKLGTRLFSQIVNESKSENRTLADTSVFLSHSHQDLTNGELDRIIILLRTSGVRVYIDSNDASMPPFTNAETARRIKQKIETNKKFVLLATNNAIASKWCNWELGFGDAKKYIENIALFPLSENAGGWQGNEYLRIYPRIEEDDINRGNFKVIFPDNRTLALSTWLRS